MDNFAAASIERALDAMALHNAPKRRMIGAVHLGGLAIECILKDMIWQQHRITGWGQVSKRNGKKIESPSHDLLNAINLVDGLRRRLDANTAMVRHVRVIQRPVMGYVSMRYQGSGAMSPEKYDEWFQAYIGFKKWLLAQKPTLPK